MQITQLFRSKEFVRYVINGIATAVFYAGVSWLLSSLTQLSLSIVISISYVLTVAFHFVGSHFVFRSEVKRLELPVLFKYLLATALNWTLNLIFGNLISNLTGDEIAGAVFAPVFPTLLNYPIFKFFVFKKTRTK